MWSTDTMLQPQQVTSPTWKPSRPGSLWLVSYRSFRALCGGPVHADENHAVIIPWATAGDNKKYSLLPLPGVGDGDISRERLSDI